MSWWWQWQLKWRVEIMLLLWWTVYNFPLSHNYKSTISNIRRVNATCFFVKNNNTSSTTTWKYKKKKNNVQNRMSLLIIYFYYKNAFCWKNEITNAYTQQGKIATLFLWLSANKYQSDPYRQFERTQYLFLIYFWCKSFKNKKVKWVTKNILQMFLM